ncbi:hypothetical protein T492DRAFT_854000 [Pavlovales sp. CCMP2436]|nr:hypothetical protein T492DRAFT_854000 [Pavlovales sp. CCMP2436]
MRSGSEGPAHPAGAGGSGSEPAGEDASTADESEGEDSEEEEGKESGEEGDDGQSADVSERDGHEEQLPAAVDTRSGARLGDGQVGPSAVTDLAERVVVVAGGEAGPSALPTPIQPTAPAAAVLPALSGAAPEEQALKAAWAELNDAGKVVWTAAAKVSATMAKAERERLDLLEAAAEPGSVVALAPKPRKVSRSKKAVADAALLNARLAHLADRDLWRRTALSYARGQGSVHLKGVAAVEQICIGLELHPCAMLQAALVAQGVDKTHTRTLFVRLCMVSARDGLDTALIGCNALAAAHAAPVRCVQNFLYAWLASSFAANAPTLPAPARKAGSVVPERKERVH